MWNKQTRNMRIKMLIQRKSVGQLTHKRFYLMQFGINRFRNVILKKWDSYLIIMIPAWRTR